MEDHIFGTYSTDALKLLREKSAAAGVQHRARILPLDPAPNEPFELIVTSGPEVMVEQIELWYTLDGSLPGPDAPRRHFVKHDRHWHTLAWGYLTEWRVGFQGLPEGTLLRYRIRVQLQGGGWRWADWPDPKHVIEMALVDAEHDTDGAPSHFALSIDHFSPPKWAESALIYQIYLDRFARGDGSPWPERESLAEFFGGTLRGVIQKLDHIASLGATCLWLSPLFPSQTSHGYDAVDYSRIEPRLGTIDDLRELVAEAHARGIRVLLDLVANHVSSDHPYFLEALSDSSSPYRDWFKIDMRHKPHGYRSFFNHSSMPELNSEHPAVQKYLIEAGCFWVETCDVDGFRLDYAHGPSHAFWAQFWRTLKRKKPDIWCLGEVVEIPSLQRRYLGYLDGLLDFQLEEALRRTFGYLSMDLVEWEAFRSAHESYFPPRDRFSRPLFLDNHDTNRFLWIAQGNRELLKLAALILYTLPHAPILYYGTELGLSQRVDTTVGGLEASREPMPWARATGQNELLAYFQLLGQRRQAEPAMRSAQRSHLHLSAEQMIVELHDEQQPLLMLVNRSEAVASLRHERLRGTFEELLSGESVRLEGGIQLPAMAGRLLKVRGEGYDPSSR